MSAVPDLSPLERAMGAARDALLGLQDPSGYWLFELEADCTIPAEYIMMMHFLGQIDRPLEEKIAVYLRERQASHGGWPLYHGGDFDISCSVKAYYALKLAGDDPEAPHMKRARVSILERGGAARSNVFTRIALAQFGQIPWRGVPFLPVEIVLLPRWFPFHLDKVSYWSRTVLVPLLILCTLRPQAKNPRQVHVRELFTVPPEQERHYFHHPDQHGPLSLATIFLVLDRVGRWLEPLVPGFLRKKAIRRAESWILERLNGEDGLGAIFPAMVNALQVLILLGYPADDPRRVTARRAIDKLLVVGKTKAYCQPCVSPVWDTGLSVLAMQDAGSPAGREAVGRALEWLRGRQCTIQGDWRARRPDLAAGGWAFQFANDHYPDLDDTAVVVWAMHQSGDPRYSQSITRALDWLVGMQSSNGGFAAFDVDNEFYYLNEIPFADHGALLDPPTSDVTARVVTALYRVKRPQDREAMARAMMYLRREQEADGSWFGRWGSNYIYGTWSVLTAFTAAGIGPEDSSVQRAVSWLKARQHADGGWGESNDTYASAQQYSQPSTPYQTAWAVLALLAAGEKRSEAVIRGVDYLLQSQQHDGLWSDPHFSAPGFPRVFYLKYHGYCAYFPLWALAAYYRLI